MKIATELTPLTDGIYKNNYENKYNSSFQQSNDDKNGYSHYINLMKLIWSEISNYFWKLVIFLLVLVIINTILRSLFVKETNLMFMSSVNNNNDNNNFNTNYMISNDEIQPNIIWIVTDLQLNDEDNNNNNKYLDKLTKQGIVLENYHVSGDIDTNFDTFISQNYEIHKLYDNNNNNNNNNNEFNHYIDDINSKSNINPFLMYIMFNDQLSIKPFNDKIEEIISYLKLEKNHNIWQNSLVVIIGSDNLNDAFSLIVGPRVPNKKRGIKSQVFFDSVDWEATLLHFSSNYEIDNVEGYDLWDTIIYNKLSPRNNKKKR